jgi:signal transduction histidine kinase
MPKNRSNRNYVQPKKYNPEVMARKIDDSQRIIQKLKVTFDHKYNALENFLSLLVNFASHDIKNAVHNLDGLVSTITPSNIGESEISSMKLCIDNIRNTLEKFSEVNITRKHNSFELSKLLGSLEILHRPFFRMNGTEFTISYEGVDKGLIVNHDLQLLLYMLNNLTINSLTALENCDTKKLGIIVKPDERVDSIVILFCDTGIGIKPEYRNRIWEPYFTTKEKGSGVGLAHVRFVMSEVRGEIILLDEPIGDFATVFKIRLPLTSNET